MSSSSCLIMLEGLRECALRRKQEEESEVVLLVVGNEVVVDYAGRLLGVGAKVA
jgi:hypothetical protein